MKKINILYVIDGIEFGGGERLFAQLVNALPAPEYEIFLISQGNPDFCRAIAHRDVHVMSIDFSRRLNPALFLRIANIIRKNSIELINGQGARAEFYARMAGRMAGRVKYVSTLQMPVEGYNVSAPVRKIYSLFDHLSERYVDRFIVVSDALKNALTRIHRIEPQRISRIYNGIEVDFFDPLDVRPARLKIREELGIGEGRPLIAGIGRMVWQKGFDWLIRSFPAVLNAHPAALLLMVGDGPLRAPLEDLVAKLNLTGKVLFTGFRADIREILAATDIFAVPSLLEGFPMVTLEAMAMQKPIVATNIEGMKEQFSDGDSGLLIPPNDPAAIALAINRLLSNPSLMAKIGANARARVVREFPIEKTLAETMEVYRSLLGRSKA